MITPIEIRQHSFKKALRGFDKEEVSGFLNTLSMDWERLLEENKRLKIDLEKTQAELKSLKQVESALHETLLQAKENAKTKLENAQKNAELKVQEAEANAKEIVKNAMSERSRIEMQLNELITRRNEILQQLKSYLQAQTERLQTFEQREMKSGEVPAPRREVVAESAREEEESFFEVSVASAGDSSIIDDIAAEL
ncbi:MAG: DivIVA domain-containing protein [Bacteroidota bacterium]